MRIIIIIIIIIIADNSNRQVTSQFSPPGMARRSASLYVLSMLFSFIF